MATPDQATVEKVLQLRTHELMALWAPIVTSAKLAYWDDHKSITNGRAVLAYMKWSSYSIISQFVGLMKSDQNAEIDISSMHFVLISVSWLIVCVGLAEARQMVLLSTQDNGQLGYWPDRDEEYPIDPKIWIARPTQIESGIEYKDFQNLMTRFKYSPGDPLEHIALEEIAPQGKGRKGKNVTRSQSTKNANTDSPAVSETVAGDTPPDNENEVSVIVAEDQNKVSTNCMVSKEVKTNNDTAFVQVAVEGLMDTVKGKERERREDSEDLYSTEMPATIGIKSRTVIPIEEEKRFETAERESGNGAEVNEKCLANDVVYIGDKPITRNMESHKRQVEDVQRRPFGERAEVEIMVKDIVKVEDVERWVSVEAKTNEERSSTEDSSEEEDDIHNNGSGDEEESVEGSSDNTEDESDGASDSDCEGLNEHEQEARKRLKRYGGLPAIQVNSSRLDAGRASRLHEQEWRVVEKVNEKAKNDELCLPVWVHGVTFTEYMKQAAVRYALMGSVGRAAHDLAELKKMNQYYKDVIVEMINLKNRNEKMMLEIEEERAQAIENERIYETALRELRGSSVSVSKARMSRITCAAAGLAVEAHGNNSSGKSKKKRALVVDRDMPLFGTKSKKLKGGK